MPEVEQAGRIFPAMRPEVKALWLAALLSKTYKQTRSFLRRQRGAEETYCCLGVLCDLAPLGKWSSLPSKAPAFNGRTGMPPGEVYAWSGLSVNAAEVLADLNDSKRASFHKIAAWIDANL